MMKKALKVTGWVLGGVVVLLVVATAAVLLIGRERSLEMVFGPMDNAEIAFETLVRKATPNQYLMCPEGLCTAAIEATSPAFEVPVERLIEAWERVVAQAPRVTGIRREEALLQRDYVQRSKLMRYPDTITVRFIELGAGRSTLAIYIRSHYGVNDFGVNRALIEGWMARLEQAIEEGE